VKGGLIKLITEAIQAWSLTRGSSFHSGLQLSNVERPLKILTVILWEGRKVVQEVMKELLIWLVGDAWINGTSLQIRGHMASMKQSLKERGYLILHCCRRG
jgi:hypothetical protein